MRKIINIVLILALLTGLCVPALAATPTPVFTDVSSDKWYYTWVTKAAQQGWVSGVGDGRFDPEGSVTFAQFALMLDRALYPDDIDSQPAGAQWWTAACEVAAKHGLFPITDMAIRDNWNAVANTPIEREQMAQMMYNALVDKGIKLPSYEEYSAAAKRIADIADVDNYVAVTTCYTIGLLNGNDNGNFAPRAPMTRAQAAVVLCNIYGYVTGDVTGSTTTPNEPDVPDEPEKPTQPDVPRPAGAVGGRYDTNKYTVPADANKDGWLTEDEVAAVIAQIMEEYPEGTPWGEDKFYRGTGWPNGGYACAAFAQMASDRIFGDLPTRVLRDAYSIRIGDVTKSTTPHWNIVRAIEELPAAPEYGALYTLDGNVGGKVGTGMGSFGNWNDGIKDRWLTIYTRYPVDNF